MRTAMWRNLVAAVAAVAMAAVTTGEARSGVATAVQARRGDSLAPYVPTPHDVVDKMLGLAGVGKTDVVYDLGSGDGRLVIAAAKQFGARGVGIDIDPERIAEARANAKQAGVESLVEFRQEDAMQAKLTDATVVTLYLLSSSNVKLRPMLVGQLKPGARVVSHQFGMGDWAPAKVETFTDSNGTSRTLYLWNVDAQTPKS
ncbi:MAG: class I SAM-dependent methyltransferase [Acidobacteria bacterium]|nr:class I SAM-dependent methyltransferase [Acidobacteriota bacterium]